MSLKEELIEDFYNEYGYLPDEHDIEAYMNNHTSMFQNRFKYHRSTTNINYPENELIEEVKKIVSSITNAVTSTARNRENTFKESDNFEEFKHMFLLFSAKTFLYFVIKNSSHKKMDFTNI